MTFYKGGGITGCNNDPDSTPSNPFDGKTNTVTSTESLAGKTLKLTFTGTETAIKCKAEIVE